MAKVLLSKGIFPIIIAFPFLGDEKTTSLKSIARLCAVVRGSKFNPFPLASTVGTNGKEWGVGRQKAIVAGSVCFPSNSK